MSGTSASRTGRVRALVDDEPALTEVPRIARGRAPHAAVLDGMPPDLAGIQVLRRAGTEGARADDSPRVLGDLVLTRETRAVHRAGRPVRVAVREFDLPVIHTVPGTGYTIRSTEDGR